MNKHLTREKLMDNMSLNANFLTDIELEMLLQSGISGIHFIGILGAGMFPLAKLAHSFGYTVTGSDSRACAEGVYDIFKVTPHGCENIKEKELAVASFAIGNDNAELLSAIENGIPVVYRAQLLGAFMKKYCVRIGVSGSHGKSTTTAIMDKIFSDGGLLPTTVSGATLYDGENLRIGSDGVFIYEACEYRDAFLHFCPSVQVITSIELDHTDYFGSLDALFESFRKSTVGAEITVMNTDFKGAEKFRRSLCTKVVTYGESAEADYRYSIVERTADSCRFCVLRRGENIFEARTSLFGKYNLLNILAAVAVADICGVDKNIMSRSISSFAGITRRMSRLGELFGHEIFYDYAHHPTEISLTVEAVKERYEHCSIVFCPHTFTRTQSLWDEFITAFRKADFTILLDIYPAREKPIDGITSENLAKAIGSTATYAMPSDIPRLICERASGAVIIMGAGDVSEICNVLFDKK